MYTAGQRVSLTITGPGPSFEYGSISFLPADIKKLQQIQNEFIRLSLKLPRYLRIDLIHDAAGLQLLETRLKKLNSNLMSKLIRLESIENHVEKSLNTIPLNRYTSPLDQLTT